MGAPLLYVLAVRLFYLAVPNWHSLLSACSWPPSVAFAASQETYPSIERSVLYLPLAADAPFMPYPQPVQVNQP